MKVPPKSIYRAPEAEDFADMDSDDGGTPHETDESGIPTGWPHDVETILEKLDHEDRKWFLLQLVLREPCFLEEARDGVPISVFSDWLDTGHEEGYSTYLSAEDMGIAERDKEAESHVAHKEEEGDGSKRKGQGKGKAEEEAPSPDHSRETVPEDMREGRSTAKSSISALPIVIPRQEWLITFAQIDALSSDDRDDFLLNLATLSEPYYTFLATFQSGLQQAQDRRRAGERADRTRKSAKPRFLRSFLEDGTIDSRRVIAKRAMERKDQKGSSNWHRVDYHHRADFDDELTKAEVYACLDFWSDTPQAWEIANAQVGLFLIQIKMSSVIQMIGNPESAAYPDRYRALRILDLLRLGMIIARIPTSIRGKMGETMDELLKAILEIWYRLDEVDQEWLKVDNKFTWGIESVSISLEEVELDDEWAVLRSALGS